MILISKQNCNIFDSRCQAIVNPVNCVGIMGAGLAKQFKLRYPLNFNKYQSVCNSGLLQIGKCYTVEETGVLIINFPTKNHWKNPSQLNFISLGMDALIKHIDKFKIKSIAIPALGCGLGGLEPESVKQIIIDKLKPIDIEVELYF